MKQWMLSLPLKGNGGMIDLYARAGDILHSMLWQNYGLFPKGRIPSHQAIAEARPITLEEVVEICKRDQPKINEHFRDKQVREKNGRRWEKAEIGWVEVVDNTSH